MKEKIIAVVNGREITEKEYNTAISKFPQDRREYFNTPEGKKQFIDQIVSWELMYNYAEDNNYISRDDYKEQLEEAKRAILAQLAIQDIISKVTLNDEEVMEYYNQNKEYFSEGEQVSARHILVDSLEKANEQQML
jgi:peptidyl-prolyl cis-trans isomerase C